MITQELITYMRQQISLGTPREIIKKNLMAGGSWKEEEVDQAFVMIDKSFIPMPPPLTTDAPQPVVTAPQPPGQPLAEKPAPAVLATKVIPTPVRVIAILHYITAALGVLFIILLVIFMTGLLPKTESLMTFFGLIGMILIVPVVVTTILSFFIGRGLYRGKNWARILVVVLGILALFSMLINFKTAFILPMAINALITGYLLFNKKVKEAFAR